MRPIRALCIILVAAALPAAAQSVPAFNATSLWWNPNESGWGISMVHHTATQKVYATWYTYDPRDPQNATSATNDFRPVWIVMDGGTWTTPTTLTGPVLVTSGAPFHNAWDPTAFKSTRVGTFTFTFSDASHATFAYSIAPPDGLPPGDPAFGMQPASGTKQIQRYVF